MSGVGAPRWLVKQVFITMFAGPPSALLGYMLAWGLGVGDKTQAHVTAVFFLAGSLTAAVIFIRRALKDNGKK